MIKKCMVCGKEFKSSPSDKKITCSRECLKVRRKQINLGKKMSDESVAKMSTHAKSLGQTENLKKGTSAAKESPKSGRFETNINAKDWILISPTGKRYECHSLNNFIRKNSQLFGIDGSDNEVNRIASGFRVIKRNIKKNRRGITYLGWTVEIPDNEKEEIL